MLGELIGAGASIIGGLLGKKSAEKNAARQEALQREFAQSGIQWKVEDAKKAGVHPLYALGANTTAYSPVSVGDPLGGAIAEAGNTIGRGVNSTMPSAQKAGAMRLLDLQIKRAELENQSLEVDIANSKKKLFTQPGTAVAIPTDGNMEVHPNVVRSDTGPLFAADPRVAMVNPPSAEVDAVKSFGLPLIRNPRKFSSGEKFSNEYGDEGLPQWIHNTGSYFDALGRSFFRHVIDSSRAARQRNYQHWRRSWYLN